jgi:TolB-like protein
LSNPPVEPAPEEPSPKGPGNSVQATFAPAPVPASEHTSIWARIKEHKIAEWTLAYVAFAFALLHGVTLLSDALEWPHVVVRSVTLLLILGVPVVPILAWYHGVRALRHVSGSELIIIALLLAIGGSLLWLVPHPSAERARTEAAAPAASPVAMSAAGNPSPPIGHKSIAVLPFADMSEKKDQEYFADGMAEEIINLLSKVPELHVPARTSSFYFKGKPTKVPEIARELAVAHVLEGSIRRAGNQIRVTAQLVRADDGYHIWSETYDRDLKDIFRVQDDIANAVVQSLQITLMGGPLTRQKGGTQNLEAYQLYLRAGSAELQNTQKSLEAERTYLEQAVRLDPSFGLAWSRMAANAMVETDNAILSPPEGFERARQLAQRALQLSPDLGEPHSVLSYIHRGYDWDWVAAETESRRALDLDPTNTYGPLIAGIIAETLGHWDNAERHLRMALARDPLNTYALLNLGITLHGAGRYADADSMYRRLLDVAPSFSWTRLYLGKTLLAEGKPEAALAIVQQDANQEDRLEILPIVLQAAGHKAEADEALKSLINQFANSSAYFVAMTYAYRSDPDLALQWLERAYMQKDTALVEIVGEPLFKNIATDPRFKAFLQKMNLPE